MVSQIPTEECRPELKRIPMLDKLPASERDAFFRGFKDGPEQISIGLTIRCLFIKYEADQLMKGALDKADYQSAIDKYMLAIQVLAGPNTEIPPREYLNPFYLDLKENIYSMRHQFDLVACMDGMAQCHVKLKNPAQVSVRITRLY